MNIITNLLQLNELAEEEGKKYLRKRDLYDDIISDKGKHFIGIVGPRGVGKTVLLKQFLNSHKDSFYISLDSIDEVDLFETARQLSENYGVTILLIDEIHSLKNSEKVLKKIYDFLSIRVLFTSSVALSMYESAYDLSRRVKLYTLFPFSYREFLFFKEGITLSQLSIQDIINKNWDPEHIRQAHRFEAYLMGGIMPFSLEEPDVFPLLNNILEKIIRKDIPSVARLTLDELEIIQKTITFIGRSKSDGINYSSIARNIGITKYKAEQYLNLLEKAFIISCLFPAGTNVLKEPKVLMALPYRLLFKSFNEVIGELREDFFVETARMNNSDILYLKTTRGTKTPDFLLKTEKGDITIEIGGQGKGREQFKGVSLKKQLILSHSNTFEGIKRPLFLFGFII